MLWQLDKTRALTAWNFKSANVIHSMRRGAVHYAGLLVNKSSVVQPVQPTHFANRRMVSSSTAHNTTYTSDFGGHNANVWEMEVVPGLNLSDLCSVLRPCFADSIPGVDQPWVAETLDSYESRPVNEEDSLIRLLDILSFVTFEDHAGARPWIGCVRLVACSLHSFQRQTSQRPEMQIKEAGTSASETAAAQDEEQYDDDADDTGIFTQYLQRAACSSNCSTGMVLHGLFEASGGSQRVFEDIVSSTDSICDLLNEVDHLFATNHARTSCSTTGVKRNPTGVFIQVARSGQKQRPDVPVVQMASSQHVPHTSGPDNSVGDSTSPYDARQYQSRGVMAAEKARNLILVAPTGAGKTWIAAEVAKKHCDSHRGKPVVMMVPTRILASQQKDEFLHSHSEYFFEHGSSHEPNANRYSIAAWVGDDHAWQRSHYGMPDVLICTHGLLDNMLKKQELHMSDIGLLVLDESHHTRKRHAYNIIMENYYDVAAAQGRPRVLGLTATPADGPDLASTDAGVRALQSALGCADLHVIPLKEVPNPPISPDRIRRVAVQSRPYDEAFVEQLMTALALMVDQTGLEMSVLAKQLKVLAKQLKAGAAASDLIDELSSLSKRAHNIGLEAAHGGIAGLDQEICRWMRDTEVVARGGLQNLLLCCRLMQYLRKTALICDELGLQAAMMLLGRVIFKLAKAQQEWDQELALSSTTTSSGDDDSPDALGYQDTYKARTLFQYRTFGNMGFYLDSYDEISLDSNYSIESTGASVDLSSSDCASTTEDESQSDQEKQLKAYFDAKWRCIARYRDEYKATNRCETSPVYPQDLPNDSQTTYDSLAALYSAGGVCADISATVYDLIGLLVRNLRWLQDDALLRSCLVNMPAFQVRQAATQTAGAKPGMNETVMDTSLVNDAADVESKSGSGFIDAMGLTEVQAVLDTITSAMSNPNMHAIIMVDTRLAACILSDMIYDWAVARQQAGLTTLHGVHTLVGRETNSKRLTLGTGASCDLDDKKLTAMTGDGQLNALRGFAAPGRHVLVGTTGITSEGLNIPTCNLMICMAVSGSGKQLTQATGRVRKGDGQMVVILKETACGKEARTFAESLNRASALQQWLNNYHEKYASCLKTESISMEEAVERLHDLMSEDSYLA